MTHPNDPTLRSFLPVNPTSDFPIQNLPYGVFSATAQRSGKITKSMLAVPAVSEGDVSTVKIDGSGWSKRIAPTGENVARPYLYGA